MKHPISEVGCGETDAAAIPQGDESLRTRLEQAAVRDQDLDREIAAEWLDADQP